MSKSHVAVHELAVLLHPHAALLLLRLHGRAAPRLPIRQAALCLNIMDFGRMRLKKRSEKTEIFCMREENQENYLLYALCK